MKILFALPFILLYLGCAKKETPLEFEQNVFEQVFAEIIDSTYRDKRVYSFHCKTGKLYLETADSSLKENPECIRERQALKNDTLNLVLAIADSVHLIYQDDAQFISKEFQVLDSKTYRIDFSKYPSRKFDFKYLSELKPDSEYENWEAKYPKFAGELSFSKIYFDKKKEKAIMTVEYGCGSKCGLGYFVHLENINRKWVVAKVENTRTA